MATKTRPELDEFVALSLVKLGLSYGETELKELRKKTPAEIRINIGRLQRLADYDAPATPAVEAATWTAEPERPVSNTSGPRRPAAPSGKVRFVASLLRELWASDPETGEELVADLRGKSAEQLDRMVENIKQTLPITEGQARFLKNLICQKLAPGSNLATMLLGRMEHMTKVDAKRHLDDLQKLPDYVAPRTDDSQPPAPRRGGPQIEADGMYRNPETGDIFKVQIAHHGSGKLYAKRLVKLDEPKTVRGKEAHYEFVYATGAIMQIKPEWRLTLEDAKQFGDLYGCCIRCGTVLTDEGSTADGIGPICKTKGW